MGDDTRLKRRITYYEKEDDVPAGEIELDKLTAVEIREILELDADDPLVEVYSVAPEAIARLSEAIEVTLDPGRFDYFIETVVRKEYISTYYATEGPPYPPPEELRAFPDAQRVRPKR